ncbi:hypothetical protein Agub_g951, partial [Astrephomene gubernaculifera]
IQQAVVLEALAGGPAGGGSGRYDTAELLVVGHDGLLPKLDMYWLLRYLLHGQPLALWREQQLHSPGATALLRAITRAAELLAPQQTARSYAARLLTALHFAGLQAGGQPAGAHAAFKDVMVDAAGVRLLQRAHGAPSSPASASLESSALSLAASLELVLRSLNNLVERVHHSPFLYLLTGRERFVSVERYVGPAVALAAGVQLQVGGWVEGWRLP